MNSQSGSDTLLLPPENLLLPLPHPCLEQTAKYNEFMCRKIKNITNLIISEQVDA